ncbi:hypothetical protein ACVBEQ_05165 [Nakamurella sp. GG22]
MSPSDPPPMPVDQLAKLGSGKAGKAAELDDVPPPGSHPSTRVVDLRCLRGQS